LPNHIGQAVVTVPAVTVGATFLVQRIAKLNGRIQLESQLLFRFPGSCGSRV